METISITKELPDVSRIAIGTWAIGGWMWGGTDEKESIATLHHAFAKGINLIDTAPVYGFGRSEEIVGKAIKQWSGNRDQLVIATKAGLEWQPDEKVFRNSTAERLRQEVDDSLKRLGTDRLDLFQIHWPDPHVAIDEVAQTVKELQQTGKIRAIGVSNYNVEQINQFRRSCPLHTQQPPYNLFEREIEEDIFPHCEANNIITLAYGPLCRGLLSGRMHGETTFAEGDLRQVDPKFKSPRWEQYLAAVETLDQFAKDHFQVDVIHLAVRWVLDKGRTMALWGARRPAQLDGLEPCFRFRLNQDHFGAIDRIIAQHVKDPIGPEFMQSPDRSSSAYQGTNPLS